MKELVLYDIELYPLRVELPEAPTLKADLLDGAAQSFDEVIYSEVPLGLWRGGGSPRFSVPPVLHGGCFCSRKTLCDSSDRN